MSPELYGDSNARVFSVAGQIPPDIAPCITFPTGMDVEHRPWFITGMQHIGAHMPVWTASYSGNLTGHKLVAATLGFASKASRTPLGVCAGATAVSNGSSCDVDV